MAACSFLPLDGSVGLCSGQCCFLCGLLQRLLHSGTGSHLQLQGGCTSNASFFIYQWILKHYYLIISSYNPYKPHFVVLLTWMTFQLISDLSYTLKPLQVTKDKTITQIDEMPFTHDFQQCLFLFLTVHTSCCQVSPL